MKNKTSVIIGFVLGMAGFLALFKVVIASILNGLLFSYGGYLLQWYLKVKGRVG
jgi:hypothetical protein